MKEFVLSDKIRLNLLTNILQNMESPEEILKIPGIHMILSHYFNDKMMEDFVGYHLIYYWDQCRCHLCKFVWHGNIRGFSMCPNCGQKNIKDGFFYDNFKFHLFDNEERNLRYTLKVFDSKQQWKLSADPEDDEFNSFRLDGPITNYDPNDSAYGKRINLDNLPDKAREYVLTLIVPEMFANEG